ncbi:hypothetical protein [Thomasclavelia cocleata]|uniref:hypothetical protein n=1 Tax=Thomasclavelia cocleata TaxID=69824 RepID=UPI001B7FF7CB|nr:hypothetical protein [Thomasclavelia cocleata]
MSEMTLIFCKNSETEFEIVIKVIISMESVFLKDELFKFFDYSFLAVFTSALV